MSAEPVPNLWVGDVERISDALGEPGATRASRRQARSLLESLALPDRARHLWRYTDPRLFVPRTDPSRTGSTRVSTAWVLEGPRSAAAVVAAGALQVLELDDSARRAGVTVSSLHTADVGDLLGQAVPATHGFVEAINAAAWAGGVWVDVPAGVTLEEPIRLRIVAGRAGSVTLPRVLVRVGKGAVAEVVESHVYGDDADCQVLGVTEILAGQDSSVRHSVVQRWLPGVRGHLTLRARLQRAATLQLVLASFGGGTTKVDAGAVLEGEGARVETFGVAMGGGSQEMDHHTEHLHHAPHTRSDLDFKVALTQAARSAYTGMIRIVGGAGASEAYQENRNLLLSPDARAESIPELEILTDDVRCSHGATVAPLDPEQHFYLRSRGLAPGQATRLVVYGFLDQTLRRLPQTTRERIEALIAERLHSEG